jgi:hypothetical protein
MVEEKKRPRRGWGRRFGRGLVVVVVAMVVICAGYVAVVAGLSRRAVSMPPLTGSYQVGRTSFDWTDRGRVDPLAPGGGPRRLSVWLWYPATGGGQPAEYAPGPWRDLRFQGPVGWFESDFEAIKVHAVQDAPVAAGTFQVVILEPGMGFSAPQYTAIAENLASHGYLVAGVTPTYSANLTVLDGKAVRGNKAGNLPDVGGHSGRTLEEGNRLVDLWAADARFVAGQVVGLQGQFAGRVKQHSVAYIGHSFGGAASLQACHLDPSCAGAVDLDGTQFGSVVQEGLRAPSMILSSEDSCVTGTCGPSATNPEGEQEAAASLVKASTGKSWRLIVDGARHFNFTDYSVYFVAPPISNLLALGEIDGRRALAIQDDYLAAFLDHVTKGGSAAAVDEVTRRYSEVKVS